MRKFGVCLSRYYSNTLPDLPMMTELIANYAAFNEWANTRIVDWLRNADPQLLYIVRLF